MEMGCGGTMASFCASGWFGVYSSIFPLWFMCIGVFGGFFEMVKYGAAEGDEGQKQRRC